MKLKVLLILVSIGICMTLISQRLIASESDNGLIVLTSPMDYQATKDKLEKILEEKGLTLFAKVEHDKNAAKVDLTLAPTTTYIFGNPKVGTPLMQCNQSFAIDLPQKILVAEDANQKVTLTYNDPSYLAKRHNLKDCQAAVDMVTKALKGISAAATAN